MKNRESRRIVPASLAATVLIVMLFGAELLIVSGALETKASTVARFAPWLREPFLKWVGEDADSAGSGRSSEITATSSTDFLADLEASHLADGTLLLQATNVAETVQEEPTNPPNAVVVEPVATETNVVEVVPVG